MISVICFQNRIAHFLIWTEKKSVDHVSTNTYVAADVYLEVMSQQGNLKELIRFALSIVRALSKHFFP